MESSSSKTRESPRMGSSTSTIQDPEALPNPDSAVAAPTQVTAKYVVGDIVGDGKFMINLKKIQITVVSDLVQVICKYNQNSWIYMIYIRF